MTEVEQYEFDRQGFIVIKKMLTDREVSALSMSVDSLEHHALGHVDKPPQKRSAWGPSYHVNAERGYHVQGSNGLGKTLIIEDFWNADPVFDLLSDHSRTMDYVRTVVRARPTINNSEIRIRYTGNASRSHGGLRPDNAKYRYAFNGRIDCMMVRMVYFIHDVNEAQGAFCVVPGSHKGNLPCPYDNDPDLEPGMTGLAVEKGDAIFFTEHLRHGGLTNRSDQVRKTLHVGYGPYWMMSQNIATMDEPQFVTGETLARYSVDQRSLFRAWPEKE
ncbi:MAG: phytanoyl-CoA dioxygenase family protein [bacterium]|nr:phytanoyl-CoA dioxygenase family protein [bacterium]